MKIRADWDPQIAKAITFLPEAQTLADRTSTPSKLASSSH